MRLEFWAKFNLHNVTFKVKKRVYYYYKTSIMFFNVTTLPYAPILIKFITKKFTKNVTLGAIQIIRDTLRGVLWGITKV